LGSPGEFEDLVVVELAVQALIRRRREILGREQFVGDH
jgi:hypothetical protein